jgi:hypothetical protein
LVTLQYALLNQDDQQVMTCRALYLMARLPA